MTKDPKNTEQRLFYHLMSSVVTPRPIALVSSQDDEQNVNLAPFSFFNMVSVNPPILVFSPLNRMRNNTAKDTLNNLRNTGELVINILGYEHVGQISLAGGEYDADVNEFIKSGLETEKALQVSPPMVKHALASFECKVNEVISLGDAPGAGNLVVCQVLMAHFRDDIINENGRVEAERFASVGRLGDNYYVKGDQSALFQIKKGGRGTGVGWDHIPNFIKTSSILTGNEISELAAITELPKANILKEALPNNKKESLVKGMIADGKIKEAWALLLA